MGSQEVEFKKILKNFTETPLPKSNFRYIVYPDNNNKEKFAFFNYTIFDLDVRNELIRNKHKELEKEAKEIQAMLKGERL